jgi:large subunit ribosomal protein L17
MAMLRGLTTELFRHGKIQTTEAKAKNVRPIAEKLITLAKRGDLHARRLVASRLYDPSVLQNLFSNVSEHFQDRNGGYTRIYKLGPRKGDAAPMALLELVDYDPYAQTKLEG